MPNRVQRTARSIQSYLLFANREVIISVVNDKQFTSLTLDIGRPFEPGYLPILGSCDEFPSAKTSNSRTARFQTRSSFFSWTKSMTDLPFWSRACASAPYSNIFRIHNLLPRTVAQCSGVSFEWSTAVTLAPNRNKRSTVNASPWYAAHMSGVCPPTLSAASTSIPRNNRYITSIACEEWTARCSALNPCPSFRAGFAPSFMRRCTVVSRPFLYYLSLLSEEPASFRMTKPYLAAQWSGVACKSPAGLSTTAPRSIRYFTQTSWFPSAA